MNVLLNPEVQRFVESKVKAGQFHSPDEAVNQILAAVQRQEELTPGDLQDLRAKVDVGIGEADRGEFVEFTAEEMIAERRAALAARKKGA